MSRGRLRRCRSAVVKCVSHGQFAGRRRMCRRLWLTSRPGMVSSFRRVVAATVSFRGWVNHPGFGRDLVLCVSVGWSVGF